GCILGGRLLAWAFQRDSNPGLAVLTAFAAFALTASAGPWPLHELLPGWDRGFQAHALSREPTSTDFAEGARLADFVAATGGPVLTEGASFVLVNRGQVAGNPMLLKGLREHDLYDPGPLVAALQRHLFRSVILLGEQFPSEV